MRRLASICIKKVLLMFGGRPILLPAALAAFAVCFWAVAGFTEAKVSETVTISVCDECGDALSGELISAIAAREGFTVLKKADAFEAEAALIHGVSEAALTVKAEYSEQIAGDAPTELITLISAPGSVSAGLIRETVLGELLAQRAFARARAALSSDGLDPAELEKYAGEFTPSSVCTFTEIGGGSGYDRAVFGRGFPGYTGFAALALMLIMLTLARGLAGENRLLVSDRLRSVPGGGALAFLSDALAPFAAALLFSALALALAPERSPELMLGLLGYDALLAGVCVLISSLRGGLRLDVASPFIALATSLLGGCFADTSSLSPALSALSMLTPQGQLIAAAGGKSLFAALLAGEGLLLAAIALTIRRRRAKK